jgi:hypothetical protein
MIKTNFSELTKPGTSVWQGYWRGKYNFSGSGYTPEKKHQIALETRIYDYQNPMLLSCNQVAKMMAAMYLAEAAHPNLHVNEVSYGLDIFPNSNTIPTKLGTKIGPWSQGELERGMKLFNEDSRTQSLFLLWDRIQGKRKKVEVRGTPNDLVTTTYASLFAEYQLCARNNVKYHFVFDLDQLEALSGLEATMANVLTQDAGRTCGLLVGALLDHEGSSQYGSNLTVNYTGSHEEESYAQLIKNHQIDSLLAL